MPWYKIVGWSSLAAVFLVIVFALLKPIKKFFKLIGSKISMLFKRFKRPILILVDFKDFKILLTHQSRPITEKTIDVIHTYTRGMKVGEDNIPKFYYHEKLTDDHALYFIEYEIKNVGDTTIKDITLTSPYIDSTALFLFDRREEIIENKLLVNEATIKDINLEKYDTFKIRVYYIIWEYVFEHVIPAINIWSTDVNGNMWKQYLYAPDPKLKGTSELTNMKKLQKETTKETAYRYFNDVNKELFIENGIYRFKNKRLQNKKYKRSRN